MKKIIVGVSGGPDSMYLLEKYRKNWFYKPIVVHINYGKRETAIRDQIIVEEYCEKHKIQLYKFHPEDISKLDSNFQAAARKYRFMMLKEVADQEKVNLVALGHHKDDFIETAMMQFRKSPSLPFYGIKKENTVYGMKVIRPLLDKYKNELVEYLDKNNIKYGIDETNLEPTYTRNKVRIGISEITPEQKEEKYKLFTEMNKRKEQANKDFEKEFENWKSNEYSRELYILSDNKERLIHELLTSMGVTSRKTKVDAIVRHIDANNLKKYRIGAGLVLSVEKGKIIVLDKNNNWS